MKIETKFNIATAVLAFIVFMLALCASAVTADWDAVKRLVDESAPGNYETVSNKAMSAVQVESDPTVPAWAKEPTAPTTMTANEVRDIANATITTNALTIAVTNRVAALETATNNLASSVSGLASSKADRPALPVTAGNLAALTADGNLADSGKKASDFAPAVEGGYLPLNDGGHVIGDTTFLGNFYAGPYGDMIGVTRDAGYLYRYDSEGIKWYYGFSDDANEIAVKGDIASAISATNPTFSNAVLAVGLNIDTNSVAVLNEIASTFGGFPIEGTATTVGGLLAALAAAVAWLKKNKVGSFESVGGATATVENGVAKLSDFFTNSNSLLTATIDARLPYPLYAVPSTGILKDRAINTTSLASVTVPDNFTDLLIRASVASSLSVTMPEAIATKYGDTFPGEAGEYLITITKTGAAEAYVRTIKLEEVSNA